MVGGGQEVIVGATTDPTFGKVVAFGLGGVLVEVLKDVTFRLAPADRGRGALDAGRHQGGRGAAGRPRRRAGRPRRARRHDPAGLATSSPTSREIARVRPQPGVRHAPTARSPPTCGSCWRRRARRSEVPSTARRRSSRSMNRMMKPRAVAVIGASDRDRQDRQLGDEEPHQRRLRGRDLPDQPEGRRDPGPQGLQAASRDVPGEVDVAVFADPGQVRARRAGARSARRACPARGA